MLYEKDYFEMYVALDDSELGRRLTALRVNFVLRNIGVNPAFAHEYDLVDIGIGAGAFVRAFGCDGFDVNPVGVNYLKREKRFRNVYCAPAVRSVTLWDAFEHIPEPWKLLANVEEWVFMSIPIFHDMQHARRSKHFKPGEHIWYFTMDGLCKFMKNEGFDAFEINQDETELGREDIFSFAFKRVSR